jgi:hypothetical protein
MGFLINRRSSLKKKTVTKTSLFGSLVSRSCFYYKLGGSKQDIGTVQPEHV